MNKANKTEAKSKVIARTSLVLDQGLSCKQDGDLSGSTAEVLRVWRMLLVCFNMRKERRTKRGKGP